MAHKAHGQLSNGQAPSRDDPRCEQMDQLGLRGLRALHLPQLDNHSLARERRLLLVPSNEGPRAVF
jgi:hypothetical protein